MASEPSCILVQEEARRIAEQAQALEESRAKWAADLGAREAALTQREDAAAAGARRQQEDLRRRAAQDEQVGSTSLDELAYRHLVRFITGNKPEFSLISSKRPANNR